MNISYKWLSEYIDISGCGPEELAGKLTMAGIEVEAIEYRGRVPAGVIAARILERQKHPDADKLSVCRVFDGKAELQIVCGAPNCDAGKMVPLATIGTKFDTEDGKGFEIKKGKLRGVESFGMLCSRSELGIDGDHSGLMELDADVKPGTPMSEVCSGDVLYELEVTPNRPDWLSHWGVARDLACLLDRKASLPVISCPAAASGTSVPADLARVENRDLCPRYTARLIRGVKVAESPAWLKERLTSIGLRPINNVVDVTNFVLHELGHPLHAFDLALLSGGRVIVRNARDKEKFVALDGSDLELESRHLVIADAERPVALAGIMGGLDSGVSEATTDILLESAVFHSSNIRATSRELGISSDSSYRFERGVDWDMAEMSSNRAVALILELAGGRVEGEMLDVATARPERESVPCRFARLRSLIGAEVSDAEIIRILGSLGLKLSAVEDGACLVTPPLYRHDISREADLAEEVARIYGLDAIPVPKVRAVSGGMRNEDCYYARQRLRSQLIGMGFMECMNYSMVSRESAARAADFEESDWIMLSNPLNLDMAVMRPSLLGEMLASLERNVARQNCDLRLFELGRVFCKNASKYAEEREELCVILGGRRHPERFSAERGELYDFYDLKGALETLLAMRGIRSVSFRKVVDARFEYGVEVVVNGRGIGSAGLLSRRYTGGLKTRTPYFAAVLHADPLLNMAERKIRFEQLAQYPATTRDVAFVAPESLEHREVMEFIGKQKVANLEKCELFDIFRNEALGEGRKSMAYCLTFRNSERTLTDKEVNAGFDKLRERLASELKVELR